MPEIVSPLEMSQEGLEAPPGDEIDLGAVRELVLRAHPDVVPELVSGGTVAEMLASVEPARAAYARLAGQVREAMPAPEPVSVPAGGGSVLPVDPALLPPAEKIRRGLQANPARAGKEG
jgi:hypothetical protein